ncbi:MAG: histidine phosphatase family protein [Brevundimonas sp.]|uniref:histidine phosphatase family protein n=1 Tax=Brevundimonas sp. TaxID=1871086 RepID=UPI0025C289D7|nr:histidine phosphatase family protein [Brevundimonas sp.]MBX3475983.1 histidine phosphatase family protein [Brevundimonas sp.]
MTRWTSFALAAAMALAASAAAAQTVILVRHGEKVDDSADAALSEAGLARAQALAQVVRQAGITQVFSTPLQRTRATVAPAAQAAGLPLRDLDLEGGVAVHAARTAATLRALAADDIALVAGHSNTIPDIVRALGVTDAADIADCEFDRLTLIELDEGAPRVIIARYGAPSGTC